ncbi:MAG: xanthine phosphoribosyltransferase [Alphaproteobacteria bacterium]|nr:xanthine phosphoribosyltransferase [Alphaproteobacteria bacterium]
MTNKVYISWEDFHKHTKELLPTLQEKQFTKIIAVSRGGLIPAGILAYELNIRNVQTINISSYDDMIIRSDQDIEFESSLNNIDQHTLIVDDISDTGRTFNLLRKQYPDAYFASVYAKPQGKNSTDKYAVLFQDQWVVFPWD